MPLPSTMTPIATTTLGSASSTVTFSSIPSTYTDLVLVTSAKLTTGSGDAKFTVNNSGGTDYSLTYLSGNGSAASSARTTNNGYGYLDSYGWVTSGEFNVSIAHFMNYANTTTYKTMLIRANNATSGVDAIVCLWRQTSAINRIDITPTASTFVAGSTFTLYGIKAA